MTISEKIEAQMQLAYGNHSGLANTCNIAQLLHACDGHVLVYSLQQGWRKLERSRH